jgi:diguanylate cyclase (GGDEF)-like protein/PAS domain S-box-containing protein
MARLLETKRLGWAITFLLVTVVGLLSYFSGKRYLAAVRAVEQTLAVESAIDTTLTLLLSAESAHRGFLLTGESRFLEPAVGAGRDISESLARLRALTEGDSQQTQRLDAMRRSIDEKLAFMAQADALFQSGKTENALELMRGGRGKDLMDQVIAERRAMLEHQERLLTARKTDAEHAENLTMVGVGVGSLVMVLLALLSLLTVSRDVGELRQTSEALAKSEEHYRLLTEHSSDLVRLLTLEGQVAYVSASVERLLGYTVDEYQKLPPLSLMHPSEVEIGKELLRDILNGKASSGISIYRLRHKGGDYRWFEVRWGIVRDSDGKPRQLHTAARDVTERREAEQQLSSYAERLRAMAIRDELTGLYNRRGFLEVAGQAQHQALRDRRPAALLFVDLNGMKRINDQLGHEQGDQALVDAAHVLGSALSEADVVARLGGDEFVAFALDFTDANLDPLRLRVRELADRRVAEHERPFRLSMSVGGAFVDPTSGETLEALLERADAAMYEQKKARHAAGGVSIPPAP